MGFDLTKDGGFDIMLNEDWLNIIKLAVLAYIALL